MRASGLAQRALQRSISVLSLWSVMSRDDYVAQSAGRRWLDPGELGPRVCDEQIDMDQADRVETGCRVQLADLRAAEATRMSALRLAVLLSLLPLVVALAPHPSPAAEAGAASFVAEFGNKVLDLVRTPHGSSEELEHRLRPLARDAFDVPRIARFVVARYWREMSDAERGQFTQAFEDYIVHVYAARFSLYQGERFAVTGGRPLGATASLVRSEITRPGGGPPIKLDWQVDRVAERYKIIDVSIDGVSQALTYREEFASVIERHGGRVSDLIAELRQKAKA